MANDLKTKSLAIAAWGLICMASPLFSQTTSCPGALGPNVFPDGSLGTGTENVLVNDPHIAPGYWYTNDPPPVDGAYCVANSTVGWDWFAELFWLEIGDNSPDPNGYMMVVNASHQPGVFYERTVPVCQNTPYIFSADIINLFLPEFTDAILPNVDFLMDGNVVFSTGDIPMDEQWHTYEFQFMPPPNVSQFSFSLRNNAPGGFGNDLALDNISLRFCGPSVVLPDVVSHCEGTLNLSPIFNGSTFQPAFYQWQTSLDGGQIWNDIASANDPSLNYPDPQDGQVFRLLIAGTPDNLDEPFCSAVSNTVSFETPDIQSFVQDEICSGESVVVGNQTFSTTGQYHVQLQTADGCDSLVHLDLAVLPSFFSASNAERCEGDGVWFGGQWLTATGTYTQQLTSQNGCDSTVVLHLEILPEASQNITASICEGSSYLFGNQALTQSGIYQQQLQTLGGCDSLVTLNLNVSPVVASQISASICEGSSYLFGNQALTQAGVYQQHLQTASGCDSLVTLNLSVSPVVASQISASICEGSSYLFGNQSLTQAGVYQQQLQTASGCDSLLTLQLIVLPTLTTEVHTAICEGAIYKGVAYEHDTLLVEELSSQLTGCDSTVFTYLLVYPVQHLKKDVFCCRGDVFSGLEINADTTLTLIQQTWQGCDSLTTFYVKMMELPLPIIAGPSIICEGQMAELTASGGVGFQWSSGEGSAEIAQANPGNYTVTVTNTDGCKATASHQLIVSSPSIEVGMRQPLCFGEANGVLEITATGGISPYFYALDGDDFSQNTSFSGLPSGNYQLTVIDDFNCEETEAVFLPEPPLFQLEVGDDVHLSLGETTVFDAQSNMPAALLDWQPSIGLDCADCPVTACLPLQTTTYQISALNENGCEATDEITVIVSKPDGVYVPNSFSPNGDGINDFFTVYPGNSVLKIKQLQVFDRWGEAVFGVWNAPPFHPETHWHGSFRGMTCQAGVYVWQLEVEYIDGRVGLLKGDLVLVK